MQYRAKNVHGWGDFSPVGSILAAVVPDAPGEPETAIGSADTFVTITWAAPVSTGGDSVLLTQYLVEVKTSDSSVTEFDTVCTFTSTSDITARTCTVELSVLVVEPFNLAQGDDIVARVSA